MSKILEVNDLKKYYGEVKAVKGVSFYADEGTLFAFLGPNGAGKSTTIDTLCTFLKPDGGSATICGHELGKDDDAIRASIGVVFQKSVLDDLLSVKENLEMRASLYGMDKATFKKAYDEAVASTGITDILDRRYGKLSGGQRRRADIARALINRPRILFLDEPTTGLDPQTRKNVWELVRSLQKQNGMTVFLTTHYMEEATDADWVVIIDDGLIAAAGTPAELKEKYAKDSIRLSPKRGREEAVLGYLSEKKLTFTDVGAALSVPLGSTLDSLAILDAIRDELASFEVVQGTMDDAFIGVTGREIRA